MSAPKTNIEKQRRRHLGPLVGMAAVVAFALLLMAVWFMWSARTTDIPDATGTTIDGQVVPISPEAEQSDLTAPGAAPTQTVLPQTGPTETQGPGGTVTPPLAEGE